MSMGGLGGTSLGQTQLSATYEEQEKAKREEEREAKRQQEDAKRGKVKQLGAKDPNVAEIAKTQRWKKEDDMKKQMLEQARLDRELAHENAARAAAQKVAKREEKWEILEKLRRDKDAEREKVRLDRCIATSKSMPVG